MDFYGLSFLKNHILFAFYFLNRNLMFAQILRGLFGVPVKCYFYHNYIILILSLQTIQENKKDAGKPSGTCGHKKSRTIFSPAVTIHKTRHLFIFILNFFDDFSISWCASFINVFWSGFGIVNNSNHFACYLFIYFSLLGINF
jgi:hypothetical protein